MTDIRTRFMEAYAYLLKEGLVTGYKDFASKISVSTSMITEISKERSNVGMTAVQNIVITFSINADWLLTGRGSMLRSDQTQLDSQPAAQPIDTTVYYNMYKEEKEENKALIEEIGGLKERIRQLEEPQNTSQHNSQLDEIALAFPSDSSGGSIKDSIHTRKPTTTLGKSSAGKM